MNTDTELGNSQFEASAAQLSRGNRFLLQSHAHDLLSSDDEFRRVCSCHRATIRHQSARLSIRENGKASFGNVVACGNVWLCPVCAPRVASDRRSEVRAVCDWGSAEGFQFLMVTFTARHKSRQPLAWLDEGMSKAVRDFKSGRAWAALRDSMGYVSFISAREVTHGANGWHPHFHDLWMCSGLPSDLGELRATLQARWVASLEKYGLTASQSIGLDCRLVTVDGSRRLDIDSYLTKIGTAASVSFELTDGRSKKPHKAGQVTPMQLLDASRVGCSKSSRLFLEYANAFRRKKQLVFGRVMASAYKDLAGTAPDQDCKPVELDDPSSPIVESVFLPPKALWFAYLVGQRNRILNIAETRGLDAAYAWCIELCARNGVCLTPDGVFVNRATTFHPSGRDPTEVIDYAIPY